MRACIASRIIRGVMNMRALPILLALSCITYGCSKPTQNEEAPTPRSLPAPTNTVFTPTNTVQAGTDSPAAFTHLLEQRWPLESIRAFCIPERRHNAMYQRLVPMPPSPVWQGALYEGKKTGFDKISWYASIAKGQIFEFDLDAQIGTNDWCLEGGTLESLKSPPKVTPDPRAPWFVGHK